MADFLFLHLHANDPTDQYHHAGANIYQHNIYQHNGAYHPTTGARVFLHRVLRMDVIVRSSQSLHRMHG
jgi:hypothetical protein